MNMTHIMLLQQEELKRVGELNYFDESSPCHIYMITRRPRITIDPNRFHIDKSQIIFPFRIQRRDQYEDLMITVPNKYQTTNIKISSDYPYNYLILKENERRIFSGKTYILLHQFGYQYKDYLNLEVLYIGQSYGVDGARTAPERLQNHSTLQSIYAEAMTKNPDFEIFLILASFEQYLLASFDGTMKIDKEKSQKDKIHLDNVIESVYRKGLNKQQVINFTEAALIRYFKPPYNIEYKNTFPNPAHSTYSECYDIDLNTISIEVDTRYINCQLFSETVDPKWIHLQDFFLHSKKERKNMFEFDNPL